MKYTKHYDMTGKHVISYEAENGYIIKGNGGRSIWGGWLPSDFWYVYDPNGDRVTGFDYLKECKAYIESLTPTQEGEHMTRTNRQVLIGYNGSSMTPIWRRVYANGDGNYYIRTKNGYKCIDGTPAIGFLIED